MKKMMSLIILVVLTIFIAYTVTPPELINIGNTCYMNSTLQCLYQIKPLTNFLLTKGHEFYKPDTVALEYINFLNQVTQKKLRESHLQQLCTPIFRDIFEGRKYVQEDASEFLNQILDHLMDQDVKDELKSTEFIQHTSSKRSPIMDFFLPLFFTYEKVTNTPIPINPNCKPRSKTELLAKLDLPIQKINTSTLYNDIQDADNHMTKYKTLKKCLKKLYGKAEFVTGDEQLNCDDGSKTDFVKETKISTSPPYLIIALKRFVNVKTKSKGFELIKDNHGLSFPLYNLDLQPYITNDTTQRETKYDLISFVQHAGSLGGGHYTAWVRSNGEWFFCNDSHIYEKTDHNVEDIAKKGLDDGFTPYILFYKRQDQPGQSIKQQILTLQQLHAQIQALAARAEEISKKTRV